MCELKNQEVSWENSICNSVYDMCASINLNMASMSVSKDINTRMDKCKLFVCLLDIVYLSICAIVLKFIPSSVWYYCVPIILVPIWANHVVANHYISRNIAIIISQSEVNLKLAVAEVGVAKYITIYPDKSKDEALSFIKDRLISAALLDGEDHPSIEEIMAILDEKYDKILAKFKKETDKEE